MARKRCLCCKRMRDVTKFYAHPGMADGRLNKCTDCCKSQAIANRNSHIDRYREYDRDRSTLPHRVSARESYAKTPAGRMSGNAAKRKWQRTNADRRAAHVILNNAIKAGTITRGPCEVCGSTKRIHGHHDDYSKPLVVRWLCPKDHKGVHA